VQRLPLLEFDRVSKTYESHHRPGIEKTSGDKAFQALSPLNLQIRSGSALGIIGESGAGKSTLASIAAGLTMPTTGRLLIDDKPLDFRNLDRRRFSRKVQLVWQDASGSVDPRYRVKDILAEPLRIHSLIEREKISDRVADLLAEVGLKPELAGRYPHQLSGGEVQRLVIARALALDPELLICDEPASALDAITKMQVAELLLRLRSQRDLALLVIGHDLPLVRMMTEELIVMFRGAIVERGPTVKVVKKPLHPYTQLLLSCDPSLLFQSRTAVNQPPILPGPLDRMPDSTQNYRGCVFESGCGSRTIVCQQGQPQLIDLGDNRQAACVLLRG